MRLLYKNYKLNKSNVRFKPSQFCVSCSLLLNWEALQTPCCRGLAAPSQPDVQDSSVGSGQLKGSSRALAKLVNPAEPWQSPSEGTATDGYQKSSCAVWTPSPHREESRGAFVAAVVAMSYLSQVILSHLGCFYYKWQFQSWTRTPIYHMPVWTWDKNFSILLLRTYFNHGKSKVFGKCR